MANLLIINADDFGYDPAVSRGIAEALHSGVVTSTTLMVNSPCAAEVAPLTKGYAVGLHLNLARWAPLSSGFPAALLRRGELDEGRAGELSPANVADETLAQLKRLEQLIDRPATHIDVHKHLHRHPNVLEGVALAAQRAQLPVRSIDEAMRSALKGYRVATNDHFLGDAATDAYWTLSRLRTELERLLSTGVV